MGGQDAIVRLKAKPKRRRRRRRGRGGGREGPKDRSGSRKDGDDRGGTGGAKDRKPKDGGRGASRSGGASRGDGERRRPREQASKKERPGGEETRRGDRGESGREVGGKRNDQDQEGSKVSVDINEQATVVQEFLRGLIDAFGFEGEVSTRVEDDVIYADIEGAETEALVGEKGAVMQAVVELARTVVQRRTQEGARIRLDIAGYGARRREALQIYARRLAEQVVDEGGEIMLEPMNPADRKVVHDVVTEIEGVRTYSEGEEPQRSVVITAE